MKLTLPGSVTGRRMLALAFLAQSCTSGITIASYGAVIPSVERAFATTRALSSMGPGVIAIVFSLLAPLVGLLLRRVRIRWVLGAGAALNAVGYFALTQVHAIGPFLLIVGLLLGSGTAMLSIFAPAALVSRWYRERRGLALAIMNLPILIIAVPPIAALVVRSHGMNFWFWCVSGLFACLIPIVLLAIDEPADVGEEPYGQSVAVKALPEPPTARPQWLIAQPQFWLLTLGVGIAAGGANAFLTHAIPFANSNGLSIASGAMLITAFGAAGLLGNVFFGWLADRIGASATLAFSSAGQGTLWFIILFAKTLPLLLCGAALFGIFCASVNALHAAAVNELFGSRNVGSVMGFGYLFKLPFIFGGPFLAGFLFDLRGSYDASFLTFAATLLIGAGGFLVLALRRSALRSAAAFPTEICEESSVPRV